MSQGCPRKPEESALQKLGVHASCPHVRTSQAPREVLPQQLPYTRALQVSVVSGWGPVRGSHKTAVRGTQAAGHGRGPCAWGGARGQPDAATHTA